MHLQEPVCVAEILNLIFFILFFLLPTGSEERGVLGVGSIPVAICPSCQNMKTIAKYLHRYGYSWKVTIRHTSEVVLRPHYSLWP